MILDPWWFVFSLLAGLGLVVSYHASPLPIPRFRPFNCGFCSSVWLVAIVQTWADHDWTARAIYWLAAIPVLAVIVWKFPWLFRAASQDDLPTERMEPTTQPTPSDLHPRREHDPLE